MARDRAQRPADARALARAVGEWLEGVQRRERALALVAQAEAADAEADALAARAAATRAEAEAALRDVPEWGTEVEKAAAWALADHAEALAQRAAFRRLESEQMLHGALAHDPDRVEAHAMLARRYHVAHRAAEGRGDAGEALRAELFLRAHAARLPDRDPLRREVDAWLSGGGTLTLLTDPPAEATLYRYEVRNRRLVPERVRLLGSTPLRAVPLETGSYLLVLRARGRAEVRYPVRIGRREDWDGVPPDGTGTRAIPLPALAELDEGDCYVPAGWFTAGGDPEAEGSLPKQRLWLDGYVMRRDPVTNREYIAFLDDLVAQGREAEALRFAPRERPGTAGELGALIYGRRPDGGFELRPDADGDCWEADWPVVMVDWFCARAYARWWAERTGRPWRLPTEMEWEKAARGVDARLFPWGDAVDPAWCCMQGSHRGRPLPGAVQEYRADESPYGVRGLGGNAMDWCADRFVRGGGLVVPPAPEPDEDAPDERARRGGAWALRPAYIRAARRNGERATNRNHYCGFRLARSLPRA
jgi:serine/threonine-protein kinase